MDICFNTSNNQNINAPPKMSDGRNFTDYRHNNYISCHIQKNNQIKNSYDYKIFLQNNAEKIMKLNYEYACQKNCTKECPNQVTIPLKEIINCNKNICQKKIINPKGMGTSVNYGNINSKNIRTFINHDAPINNCKNNI